MNEKLFINFSIFIVLIFQISIFPPLVNSNTCDPDFPWDDSRLPKTTFPTHYDLILHPNLTDFKFRGSASIVLNSTEFAPSNFFIFNSVDLELENFKLRQNDQDLKISWKFCPEREQVAIIVDEGNLTFGGNLNFSCTFRGNLTDTLKGFYRSSYSDGNGTRKYMAITQFSPTDARRMFPCWDEPEFKATFKIGVIRDRSMISLSNMPLIDSQNEIDNLIRDQFETTLKMSTYLIAVAVFDFPKRTKMTKNGVEISLYAPSVQIDQTQFALDVAVDSMEFHESFLKIPYPLKKLDIVAVGDFAFGAMENWGLMTFRDTIILHDKQKSSTWDEDQLTQTISHEIGHQWFGNLVTMRWWSELWLKEGFARFLESYAASKIRPEWGLMELFGPNVFSLAFNLDGLKNTHPVFVPVRDTSEIRGIFDAISYNKGASIIFMLLNVLGEENLASGLNAYLTKFQYSNAEGAQFWEVISEHSPNLINQNLSEIADTWTLQPGYPYISVTANKSGLILHQERFYFLRESEDEDDRTSQWSIPFTYLTDSGESGLHWFNATDTVIPLDTPIKRWFKANVNGTGFYRVLYTPRIWRALAKKLKEDVEAFSTTDRSNLLMDAFGFVRAGLMNFTLALDLVEYLRNETEYGPWKIALDSLDYIGDIHVGSKLQETIKLYTKSILEPAYNRLNWTLPSDHKQKRFAAKILTSACNYEIADCNVRAMELFESWKRDGRIDPDLLKVATTRAIVSNSEGSWDTIWRAYLNSKVPAEKTTLLGALSLTPDRSRLIGLLNASLDSNLIRANLLPILAANVAQNRFGGSKELWNFTQENWSRIYKVAGGTAVLGNYLSSALINFSEMTDLHDIEEFFVDRDVDGARRALDQTLENIRINIQWRENNDADLQAYMESNLSLATSDNEEKTPYE